MWACGQLLTPRPPPPPSPASAHTSVSLGPGDHCPSEAGHAGRPAVMGPKAPPSGHIKDGLLGRSEDSTYPTAAGLSATPSRLSPLWDLPLSSSGPSRGSLFRAPPQWRQGRRAQSDTLLPAMSRLLSPPWSRPTVGKWLPWLRGPLPSRPGQEAFEYAPILRRVSSLSPGPHSRPLRTGLSSARVQRVPNQPRSR